MKTGTGLAVVAFGAILAFAVTGSPSFINIHIAGWVIMLAGVLSMVLSRQRDYGQLWRRLRPRVRVWERDEEPRAIVPGEVFHTRPDGAAPLPEPRPTADGATADSAIPGSAEHAEGTAQEHPQE